MRRMFSPAILAIILIVLCHADDNGSQSFGPTEAGIKIGMNFTKVRTDLSYENYKIKIGAHAGCFLVYRINDFTAFRPELCFSWKTGGANRVSFGSFVFDTVKADVFYFELPILIRFSIQIRSFITAGVLLGPALDYNVYASHTYGETTEEIEDLRKLDAALIIGTNIRFRFEKGNIIVDFRYSYGFLPIYESGYGGSYDTYSDVFSLGMGYAFKI